MNNIILASKSPRRKDLLEQAGLSFTVISSDVDEKAVPITMPHEYVKTLALLKANDIAKNYPKKWAIGADTIVAIDDKILGKPDSEEDAKSMLLTLSGRVHQVYTGYAICCINEQKSFLETVKTDVLFKILCNEEIEWYIKTNEPFDKAGGYAIQGHGAFFVKSINGSYTNVVGLPICEIIECLLREKIINYKDLKINFNGDENCLI